MVNPPSMCIAKASNALKQHTHGSHRPPASAYSNSAHPVAVDNASNAAYGRHSLT